ncbi:MAG: alpha/beta fold hydrolase [Woeseiaceae bacterium]
MSFFRKSLWAWVALLLLSNAWRFLFPATAMVNPEHHFVNVQERIGSQLTGEHISIAYRQYGELTVDNTPVLLLHGTPVASSAMRGIATALAEDHYVISPDLPGFGGSIQPLPDYSSITHGLYMRDLLAALDIKRVHIVAYSQGGAPAITLAARHPEQVVSVTMIATIGVQELELFGSYRLNHAVYQGQLALIRAAQWLLPHFGFLDNAILGPGYARNLTDTDQRQLRPMFRNITAPVLIMHGESDGLVPYEAALEHYRLLPQSTLISLSGGHEIAYAEPTRLTPDILSFLLDVDQGKALTRNRAPAERQITATQPMPETNRQALGGIALVVLILAIIVASYVSEDLACIAAGLLAAKGVLSFGAAVGASLTGLFTGDLALFAAGRWLGEPALNRWLSEAKLARAKHWLKQRGPFVIIASRFMPGTRLPTYVAAGALHMPWLQFAGYFALATVVWTPLLVGLAMAYGEAMNRWFADYAAWGVWILIGGVVFIWWLVKTLPPLLTHEGRRLAHSRWMRLTRFEYWPRSAFYSFIVLYCIGLSIRYRSATLFTLANPAMPLGGLIGEPKAEILAALTPSGCVAPFCTLDHRNADAAARTMLQFMDEQSTTFPIVLKPNIGQRGGGVEIITTLDEAKRYLKEADEDIIAQVFTAGEEYGVFYLRLPNEEKGFIYSITHKGETAVRGDGQRDLKSLILDDQRAVGMARFFLDMHAERLDQVPKQGERIVLNQIGTHSRGSLFTDATHLITPALSQAVEHISRHYEGFYFGRYDLIAPDQQSLTEGRDLKVLELNGVSSEATHIYDPSFSLMRAWQVIAKQWHYAYRIGDQLRKRGLQPASIREIIQALRNNSF